MNWLKRLFKKKVEIMSEVNLIDRLPNATAFERAMQEFEDMIVIKIIFKNGTLYVHDKEDASAWSIKLERIDLHDFPE